MVLVPKGVRVTVDLWSTEKKKGMVKYQEDTQFLVRGESEFKLKKGDAAIVVESYEGFVRVIPYDDYTRVFSKNMKDIDTNELAKVIYQILKDGLEEDGGIISIDELYLVLKETSLRDVIKKSHLEKAAKSGKMNFFKLKYGGDEYLALLPQECPEDEDEILALSKKYDFLTFALIREKTGWKDYRIERVMEYLVSCKACKKDSSYKNGVHYYFHD